jgi:secreted trypsin-like serine protease
MRYPIASLVLSLISLLASVKIRVSSAGRPFLSFVGILLLTLACGPGNRKFEAKNPDSKVTIVGGKPLEDSPAWVASLRHPKWGHFCGGSIIAPGVVLTAAHCFLSIKDYKDISVYLGLSHLEDIKKNQIRATAIKKVVLHPRFTGEDESRRNDIALIFLKSAPWINSENILPTNSFPDFPHRNTKRLRVYGMGDQHPLLPIRDGKLHFAQVPNIPLAECRKFRGYQAVPASVICAGEEDGGPDTCTGDSGGPMTAFLNGKEILIGVTSWGEGCGEPEMPTIYTRVSWHHQWVEEEIRRERPPS